MRARAMHHLPPLAPWCVQANKCWEARASEDELGGDAEGKVASKPDAADFKQLKILLRMLEDRIAQAVPSVRKLAPVASEQ